MGYKEDSVEKLSYSKPIFYREDGDALHDLQISEDARKKLPPKFFQNPTKFIEALNLVERGGEEFGHDIDDLAAAPYDFTRVKRYKKLVFKRVDLSKVNYGTEEIDEAQKVAKLLGELGDQRVRTQNFVGFIYDQGNIYLISEFIPNSENLWDSGGYNEEFDKISSALSKYHIDCKRRNVLVQYKNKEMNRGEEKAFILIDFETKK